MLHQRTPTASPTHHHGRSRPCPLSPHKILPTAADDGGGAFVASSPYSAPREVFVVGDRNFIDSLSLKSADRTTSSSVSSSSSSVSSCFCSLRGLIRLPFILPVPVVHSAVVMDAPPPRYASRLALPFSLFPSSAPSPQKAVVPNVDVVVQKKEGKAIAQCLLDNNDDFNRSGCCGGGMRCCCVEVAADDCCEVRIDVGPLRDGDDSCGVRADVSNATTTVSEGSAASQHLQQLSPFSPTPLPLHRVQTATAAKTQMMDPHLVFTAENLLTPPHLMVAKAVPHAPSPQYVFHLHSHHHSHLYSHQEESLHEEGGVGHQRQHLSYSEGSHTACYLIGGRCDGESSIATAEFLPDAFDDDGGGDYHDDHADRYAPPQLPYQLPVSLQFHQWCGSGGRSSLIDADEEEREAAAAARNRARKL